jgi:hypothetical protein
MTVTESDVRTYNHADGPAVSVEIQRTRKMAGNSELLVSSPYSGEEHHLDLSTVDERSRQLALALQNLHPTTKNYPSDPYSTSFNWQQIVDHLPADFEGVSLPPSPGVPLLTLRNRKILLHSFLFHTPSKRGQRPFTLPRRSSPRRSQYIRRPPKILVAKPTRSLNPQESSNLPMDKLGPCETSRKITHACKSYDGYKRQLRKMECGKILFCRFKGKGMGV